MSKRVQSLQALRGLAFLLIFFSHCTFVEIFSSSWGAVGVSVFIILSGYVVTFNSSKTDIRDDIKAIPYLLKRIKKVYPLHIVMLCTRLAFDYSLGITTSIIIILLNVTMLKSFIPIQEVYYSLGGVSWYLSLVCLFALLTPLLLKILKSLKKKHLEIYVFILILTFRMIWIFLWHGSNYSLWLNYVNPFFRITDYFLGMILGINIDYIKKFLKRRKSHTIILTCIVWIIFCGYIIAMPCITLPWYFVYLRTPLSLGLIIIFTVSNTYSRWEKTILYENKFLIYLGNISFELFLMHTQIKYIVTNIVYGKVYNNIVLLVLIFSISVITAQIYSSVEIFIRKKFRSQRKVN